MDRGIGYVDVHLLAATALAGDALMWTRDRRLSTAAAELKLSFEEEGEEQPHGEETKNT